jgi:hypothetical protein
MNILNLLGRHRDGREFDGAEDAAGIQWTDIERFRQPRNASARKQMLKKPSFEHLAKDATMTGVLNRPFAPNAFLV